MEIKKIGKRGTLFTFGEGDSPFEYPTNIYLIEGQDTMYLCDTHVGPSSMDIVKEYIAEEFGDIAITVINTHSDYDHVWGNCAFSNSPIIAHRLCREEMQEKGEFILKSLIHYTHGAVTLRLPNITFEQSMHFEEDYISLVHMPSHSKDLICVYDHQDKVIFAGDMIELPIPYLGWHDLNSYSGNLKKIYSEKKYTVIASHCTDCSAKIIKKNMDYVKDFNKYVPQAEHETFIHEFNLKSVMLSKLEESLRKKLRTTFSFSDFAARTENLTELSFPDFRKELKKIQW